MIQLTRVVLSCAFFCWGTVSEAQMAQDTAVQDDPDKPNVAIVLYDGVQIIDFTGPYEVFGQYSRNDVYTVAATTEPITTTMGLEVVPSYSFEQAPPPDVLVVPGGTISRQREDAALLEWIHTRSTDADYTLSVCNGAFLLAEAGLLNDLQATTFYDLLDELEAEFPTITVVDDRRFVDNGRIITSAGLSSGIDAALHVQARLHGSAWAKVIALNMEYDWQPKTDYARSRLADMNAPSSLYDIVWPDGVLKVYDGDRDHWVQTWQLESTASRERLVERLAQGVSEAERWQLISAATEDSPGMWSFTGRDGRTWRGEISVEPVSGNTSLYEITVVVRAASQAFESSNPTWSPDGARLFFYSNRDGNFDLYVMQADGSNVEQLTQTPEDELYPALSPDGTALAYAVRREDGSEIYVMQADGSNQVQLTQTEGSDWYPRWSPDGRQIVFESHRDGNPEIYVMQADGSHQRRLTKHPAHDLAPSWSPDGQQIVFQSSREGRYQLYVMEADGSNQRRLAEGEGNWWSPAWSSSGDKIVFCIEEDIYVLEVNSSNVLRLTQATGPDMAPVWSPDGSKIAFMSGRDAGWAIYVMNADGSEQTRLSSGMDSAAKSEHR